jgi:hypothetical protein
MVRGWCEVVDKNIVGVAKIIAQSCQSLGMIHGEDSARLIKIRTNCLWHDFCLQVSLQIATHFFQISYSDFQERDPAWTS